jgi:hypothetical protein
MSAWAPPGTGRVACFTGEAVPQTPGSWVRPAESRVVSQYDCAPPVKPQKNVSLGLTRVLPEPSSTGIFLSTAATSDSRMPERLPATCTQISDNQM